MKQCGNDSMFNNAMKVREICESDTGECGVSIDGTWHNGVVTAISLHTNALMSKSFLTDASNASSGVRNRMIQNILNGKQATNVRQTILGVLEAWRRLVR